jgi:hypothetical protein
MKRMLVGLLMVAAIGIGFSFGSSSATADEGVVSILSDGDGANPAATVATPSAEEFTSEQAVDGTCGESAFPGKARCPKTPPNCCCWDHKKKECVCRPPRKSDGKCGGCAITK